MRDVILYVFLSMVFICGNSHAGGLQVVTGPPVLDPAGPPVPFYEPPAEVPDDLKTPAPVSSKNKKVPLKKQNSAIIKKNPGGNQKNAGAKMKAGEDKIAQALDEAKRKTSEQNKKHENFDLVVKVPQRESRKIQENRVIARISQKQTTQEQANQKRDRKNSSILPAVKGRTGKNGSYDMEQAVNRALKHNISLESKGLIAKAADLESKAAWGAFFPRAAISGGTQRLQNYSEVQTYNSDNLSGNSWNYGVRLSYPLFAGFAHLNELQKRRVMKEMENERLEEAKLSLACEVRLAFIELLRFREEARVAMAAIERNKMQIKAAQAFYDQDMGPLADILRGKAALAEAEKNLLQAKNGEESAATRLDEMLGISGKGSYAGTLPDGKHEIDPNAEKLANEAIAKRPDIRIAEKSIEVAAKDMGIAASAFFPRVDANYDNMRSGRNYDNDAYKAYDRAYWGIGINFTWEFFSGGETFFRTKAAKNRMLAFKKDYEQLIFSVKSAIKQAVLDVANKKSALKAMLPMIEYAREAWTMQKKRYDASEGTITELIDAQAELARSEREYVKSLYDFWSARVNLAFNAGLNSMGNTL